MGGGSRGRLGVYWGAGGRLYVCMQGVIQLYFGW